MNHPIDCSKHEWVEVFWLTQWHLALYESWEPIAEEDFRQPKENGRYTVIYNVKPIHLYKNRICPLWSGVHESRIRIVKLKKHKDRIKILEKKLYGKI